MTDAATELAALRELLGQAEAQEVATREAYEPHREADERRTRLNSRQAELEDRGVAIRQGRETSIGWDQHLEEVDRLMEERRELRAGANLAAAMQAKAEWEAAKTRRQDLTAAYTERTRDLAPWAAANVGYVERAAAAIEELHKCMAAIDSLARALGGSSGGPTPGYRLQEQLLVWIQQRVNAAPAWDGASGPAVLAAVRDGSTEFGDLTPYLPGPRPVIIDGGRFNVVPSIITAPPDALLAEPALTAWADDQGRPEAPAAGEEAIPPWEELPQLTTYTWPR